MVIYLDDIRVFSKCDAEHIDHLRQTFEKGRRYGLSLNPQKSVFALEEGKLLGHIVTKEEVKIERSSGISGKKKLLKKVYPKLC